MTPAGNRPPVVPGLALEEQIGAGGAGTVYRALHQNLQRTVAVKFMPASSDEGTAVQAWLRESRLMASLAHPHVVTIYDAGQVEGTNYFVMEHMAGGSLRARMKPGQAWTLARVLPLLAAIAQALDHIHRQGVLHLDLKPENVLFTADDVVKISDFGLSIPRSDAENFAGQRFHGTLDYMAPEARSGLAVDGRFDVFALATIAYELLTGCIPGRVYVAASKRNPALSTAVDDALERGLARNPSDRFDSASSFQQALENAAAEVAFSRRGRLRRAAIAAGFASLLLIPAAIAFFSPNAADRPPLESNASTPNTSDKPDTLVILYDRPEDLAFFRNEDGTELSNEGDIYAEPILLEGAGGSVPEQLPFPVLPSPRPMLVIHSPGVWGFVYPMLDHTLARRVVAAWDELCGHRVPPSKYLVKAGDFSGDCLARGHQGSLWRAGDSASWNDDWRIVLDRPEGDPAKSSLFLTNLKAPPGKPLLGTYQPLAKGPPPGATFVLRYRARSRFGRGSLAVYLAVPLIVADDDDSPPAERLRRVGSPIAEERNEKAARSLYRAPNWITPGKDWQTYLVICECPSFPSQALHRNLVIDLKASHEAARDQVWVDDVELFVWSGSDP